MAPPNIPFEDKIKLLQVSFIKDLPDRLQDIGNSFSIIETDSNDYAAIEELTRKLHSLAGSGATFGLPKVTELAREGENLLKVKTVLDNGIDQKTTNKIKQLLTALMAIKTDDTKPSMQSPAFNSLNAAPKNNREREIFILERDDELALHICNQFHQYGCHAHKFDSIDDFTQAINENAPDVVLIDLLYKKSSTLKINHLIKKTVENGIYTIVSSENGDIHHRLNAARANADMFFIRPFEISEIIDRIDSISHSDNHEPYRVLIVDDSYELAKFYSLTLENAGFDANYITKPLSILETITHYQPELILLDLYMPECTGLELAAVIRQQGSYIGVPIVFLSSEMDKMTQLTAMQQGGDEFLTKPIQPEHLVSAVKTRIDRYRQLKSLFIKDSLTGLHNHTSIKHNIETEIMRAKRNRKQVCLVMIDIDYFKDVNDKFGHQAGDKVLKGLARLMRQRLRQTDVLGRYGGDEFIVILPETDITDAEIVISKLRQAFENLKITDKNTVIPVSITCGIASYPPSIDCEQLCEFADNALYKAKEQGRNQVAIYEIV